MLKKLALVGLVLLGLAASVSAETLRPFYRGMQLQGHLFGFGLVEIPDYLSSADIAFPYKKKARFAREIPFVDSFVINRALGGYREEWLRKSGLWKADLQRRSLDYVTKDRDGTLRFRPDLIKARLQPYLEAGYKPSDITLALDTPWDLATPNNRPVEEGQWGRRTPPGDLKEWKQVVQHLASDLKSYLGDGAQQLHFETGIEYDKRANFDGDAETFFRYYEATNQALHGVLPNASLNPGEFTGTGECESNQPCVYDSKAFLDFARAQHLPVAYLPRSLNAFQDRGETSPAQAAQRFVASYRRLPSVAAEIHQFGLMYEPFGRGAGSDPGPMRAAWEFETLARMMIAGPPARAFHWGGFVAVGKHLFLDGSGFLRLALDHYLGADVSALTLRDAQTPYQAELFGLALTDASRTALIVASFSPRPQPGARKVMVDLPERWTAKRLRLVRYRASHNIFATVKQDLAKAGNLRSDFANCAACLGPPVLMATDLPQARMMLVRNWSRYEAEMHDGLKWTTDASTGAEGTRLNIELEANELAVIEPVN